ncbi:VOC family protein [Aestuariibacter halophilus]|uniref:VOC family protein n=1 Tax=Fluctibacter halophilus TaxID=226011 RepID=A0ABS8G4L8_9ALTE|nr:VOC family protein [Aestuariibacter halophilus]MCC2615537.1 VOC family protein [Aestuariibacter halophilus]
MDTVTPINYIEIPCTDLARNKQFFHQAFGWTFTDYGEEYAAVNNAGIDAGLFQAPQSAHTDNGSVLVVLYQADLERALAQVEQAGGNVIKPIFSFPGGRRFQFACPGGSELAVWSDQ